MGTYLLLANMNKGLYDLGARKDSFRYFIFEIFIRNTYRKGIDPLSIKISKINRYNWLISFAITLLVPHSSYKRNPWVK